MCSDIIPSLITGIFSLIALLIAAYTGIELFKKNKITEDLIKNSADLLGAIYFFGKLDDPEYNNQMAILRTAYDKAIIINSKDYINAVNDVLRLYAITPNTEPEPTDFNYLKTHANFITNSSIKNAILNLIENLENLKQPVINMKISAAFIAGRSEIIAQAKINLIKATNKELKNTNFNYNRDKSELYFDWQYTPENPTKKVD